MELSGLLQTLVTLGRGKHAQVLTRQEAGWAREAVLKVYRKENSLTLARKQTHISRSTSHSLRNYSDWATQLILFQGTRNFQNSYFKDYKILYYKITWSFHSYGSQVQLLKGNNTEERKTSSQTVVEITIFRSIKEWYHRGTGEEFRHNVSFF